MNLINVIEEVLDKIKKPIYLFAILLIYSLYFLILLGFIPYSMKLVSYLNIFLQTFICLFLIIRFHPYRKHELKEFDATIIFGSGIFLLTNLGIVEYVKGTFENLGKKIVENSPINDMKIL